MASNENTSFGARWHDLARMVVTRQALDGAGHVPVLLAEVLAAMSPADGETYVDGTFGAGGYARALLEAADCRVIALDRDPEALAGGQALAASYAPRLSLHQACFGDMRAVLPNLGLDRVDGIVVDLGVSSMQIDQAARGFSFRDDGPLDMRMGAAGESAADIINTAREETLADIFFHYGEERAARRIARKIIAARKEAPIRTTRQLAALIHDILPMHGGHKIDTATRSFQALRIAVNDELGEIERLLADVGALLRPGGRIVVVSFHSLEDGIVKRALRAASQPRPQPSRHAPQATATAETPLFTLLTPKPIAATAAETAQNPRARSARLRAARRTDAPVQETKKEPET